MVKPMETLDLHYPMTQFLIMNNMTRELCVSTRNWKCPEMSNFTDIIEIRIKLGTVFLDKWFRINFFSETEKPVSMFGLSHLFLKCLFNLPKNIGVLRTSVTLIPKTYVSTKIAAE